MKNRVNFVDLIKDILGEKQYLELLKDISMENSNSNIPFEEFFNKVTNKYCFLIFMIGFSKRVEIEEYTINKDSNKKINSEVFVKRYEKYIKQVENTKFNFLKDII